MIRMWSRLLGAATAVCCLVLSATPVHADEQPDVADQVLHLIQFNMCGSSADCPNQGGVGVANATVLSIQDWGARLVTLNEVCYSQYMAVKNGTGHDGRFFETNGPNSGAASFLNSCSDDRFGNAVLSDNVITGVPTNKNLPHPSTTELRKANCATSKYLHTLKLCVTHIANASYGIKDDQVQTATLLVNPLIASGFPLVFGGDFNGVPSSGYLNQMYNYVFTGGYGLFGEGAQRCGPNGTPARCGAATHTLGKIDYMFMDGVGGWCCPGAAVGGSSYSDHDVLRVSLRLQP